MSDSKKAPRALLRLDALPNVLSAKLEDEVGVLELLVAELGKGQEHPELWDRFHQAAARDDLLAELAFAYEQVISGRKFKLVPHAAQIEVLMHAATFYDDVFGDYDGAIACLERVLAIAPAHEPALDKLAPLMRDGPAAAKLADHFGAAAAHKSSAEDQSALLGRALDLVRRDGSERDRAIRFSEALLKLDPGHLELRRELEQHYAETSRFAELAQLFERTLASGSCPENEVATLRTRLVRLYTEKLGESERAMPHLEEMLKQDPQNLEARTVAEQLLGQKSVAARASGALAAAYEELGANEKAAEMLTMQLEYVRGARRLEVQRHLAQLREQLGDYDAAQSLYEALVTSDPSDDEVRSRYIDLSRRTEKLSEAAKAVGRAVSVAKDPAVRARAGTDLAKLLLEAGEPKRARTVLQDLLNARANEETTLFAARALVELYDPSREAKSLAPVLELLADAEPDPEARLVAAERLARLCENELDDRQGAITAWQRLVESPMREQALRSLETHFAAAGANDDLASVLETRASESPDPDEARSVAFRAAEIRVATETDRKRTLGIWMHLLAVHGPSREAHERVIPLLEELERWQELALVLRDHVVLATDQERAATLVRLADVHLNRLGDAPAAIDAYGEVLMLDPEDQVSRAALEKLLDSPEHALAAGDVLEPLYRATESLPGLIRVLEVRAASDPNHERRRAALEEAVDLLADRLDLPERALELATGALADSVQNHPGRIAQYLARIARIAKGQGDGPPRIQHGILAEHLLRALGERSIDSPPVARLAENAAEALAEAHEIDRSVALYRQLIAFEPTPERQARLRQLVIEHGKAEDRVAMHRAVLEKEQDARERRSLFLQIVRVERDELSDTAAAIATCQRALEEFPGDAEIEDALADAYAKAGDLKGLYEHLQRALTRASAERRNTLLLRMGEVSIALGETTRALDHYREVIQSADVDPSLFDRIEAAAAAQKQGDFLRDLYDRRIAKSPDRFERAGWLERLGEVQLRDVGDAPSAVSSWKRAARLCEEAPPDRARARALYERVLGAAPDDVETAERLLVLYGEDPDPRHMPTVYATLLKSATDDRVAFERLLEFEQHAIKAGALDEFCRTVDEMLTRHMASAAERAGDLMATKARVLATDPSRRPEADAVLESLDASSKTGVPTVHAHRRGQSFVLPWNAHEVRERKVKQLLELAAALDAAGDSVGAVNAYQNVLAADPERLDARYALARLLPELGDAESALAALGDLVQKARPGIREALELQIAGLYLDHLDRPVDAMAILEQRLAASPTDVPTIRLLERALARPEVRARAAGLLERASQAVDDEARAARLLEALLAAPPDAPELVASRARIYERLLDSRTGDPEAALQIALRAVAELPENDSFWARLDQVARRIDKPVPVAEAYKKAFAATEDPILIERIGRRAVEFYEEWFDDIETVVGLLRRMMVFDSTRWSFERLKVLFSSVGRWDDFFALYDETLATTADPGAQAELLEEAASAAKDVAKDADRAIAYYERRAAMGDAPATIPALLERLYERSGYTGKLIDLLTSRLPHTHGETAQTLRSRLANLWLSRGNEPQCFALAEQILAVDPKSALALDLLARIVLPRDLAPADRNASFSLMPTLGGPRASRPPARASGGEPERIELAAADLRAAAGLLYEHYRSGATNERVVAVLRVLLETAETDAERIVRHRDLATALGELGNRAGVFEHLAQLVRLEPSASEHRKAFIALADELGTQAEAVSVLIEAADACENSALAARLVFQAAGVCRDRLKDTERAISLFGRAMELARGDAPLVIASARQLDPLLASASRDEERCTILERIAEVETEAAARRAAIGESARIASETLGDRERAIRLRRIQLSYDPRDREALDTLAALFEQDRRYVDLVEILDQRARILDPELARRDRVRIARIHAAELGNPDAAIEAWRAVREEFGIDEETFDALGATFESLERWQDLADLVEEQAGASAEAARRVELYGRLGDLLRDRLNAVSSATDSYRAALALDAQDLTARRGLGALVDDPDVRKPALDGLARAYVQTDDWTRAAELARTLRAEEDVPSDIARAFWWGVARHERDVRGELEPAEAALFRAHGHDPNSLEILTTLAQVQGRTPGRALIETLVRLSEAKAGDLSLLKQATEVALRDVGDRQMAAELLDKTLAIAIERWTNVEVSMRPPAEAAHGDKGPLPSEVAAWALDELVRLGYEEANYARVVELLLRGADLPFEQDDVRRMRREAASIQAERLHEPALAIGLYRGLLEEDPKDESASKSVTPLAELLEKSGQYAELAALWEQQAAIRAETDRAGGAELWTRAARISEERLGDLDRAVSDYEHAAGLAEDPRPALDSLARLHAESENMAAVAAVLERLATTVASAELPPIVIRLAETYLALGDRSAARARLERAVESTGYEQSLSQRLAALYEEDQEWIKLAELFAEQAKQAPDRRVKLGHLRKAADIYLSKKDDRESAIPLLEEALELAPDTSGLSLSLADALAALGRFDRARDVLARQVERYADRRPKHRALVHFALGRVLASAGDRKAALAELETSARIDPTHAGIVQTLARLARDEGQLERAQQSFEALLLLRRSPDDRQAMSRSEILLALAEIADAKSDPARAEELRESAQVVKKARETSDSDAELEVLDAGFFSAE